jgi:hypothetical protein
MGGGVADAKEPNSGSSDVTSLVAWVSVSSASSSNLSVNLDFLCGLIGVCLNGDVRALLPPLKLVTPLWARTLE